MTEPQFYTVKGLAHRLNVSERKVYEMLATRRHGRPVAPKLPSYRVEGSRRIDPADVDRYLQQRREEAA